MAKTVAELRAKREALELEEKELRQSWADAYQDKKQQEQIGDKLRRVSAARLALGQELQATKEQERENELEVLLSSRTYRQAAIAGAADFAHQLEPWIEMIAQTELARRRGIQAPKLPPPVASLYIEAVAWLSAMVRRGVLTEHDVPELLRPLIGR